MAKMQFRQFLREAYVNLIGNDPKKRDYASHVFNMLQKSYAPIGGIAGSGFKSPDDMIQNIHMWKLTRRNGQITHASMYKKTRSGFRKRVAVTTDQTEQGKKDLLHSVGEDLKQHRSFSEVSGPLLHVMVKHLGNDILKHAVKREHVNQYINHPIEPVHPEHEMAQKYPHLKDHLYTRKIGGISITKLLLGHKSKFYDKEKK
jgi:hypothetical protein